MNGEPRQRSSAKDAQLVGFGIVIDHGAFARVEDIEPGWVSTLTLKSLLLRVSR